MSLELQARVRAALRDVPDFPWPGIVFKDLTPLLADAPLFAAVIDGMAAEHRGRGITHVAGVESRGFILASPIAVALEVAFIPVRKPGKLPWRTISREYVLEYGTDRLELHVDACGPGDRVLLVDDLLATGGTASAAAQLIEETGATVAACSFLVEIAALAGATRLAPREVRRIVSV